MTHNGDNLPSSGNTTRTTISLEMAERMLIKYDGDKTKLHEFIDNSTLALSLVSENHKNILFQIIKTKVCDRARLLIKNRDFANWTALRQYLLDSYTDKHVI